MDNVGSEDNPERTLIHAKLRSPDRFNETTSTMDSPFQDGGQPNVNSEQRDFPSSIDSSGVNTEVNYFPHSSGDSGMGSDTFGRMNEPMYAGQMTAFGGYSRSNFSSIDQHGSINNSEYGNHNMQFSSQYQPGVRQPFKSSVMSGRSGMSPSNMSAMSPGYINNSQQRMMSGQSISQQAGPTPTLNQLLQSPNSNSRFQNDYGGGTATKGSVNEEVNMPYSGYTVHQQQGWGPGTPRGIGTHPQSQGPVSSAPSFRSQSTSSNEMNHQRRPGPCVPPGYPQQGSHIPSNQQFPQVNQRYGMMPGQSRPSHMSAMAQSYPQQVNQPPGHMGYNNQHASPASQPFSQQYINQQQTSPVLQQSQPPVSQLPASHSTPPHQMPHSQNHPQQSLTPTSLPSVHSPQPSPQQCSPQSNSTVGSQHNKSSDEKNEKDGSGNISDDLSSDNLQSSRATSTPTSTVQHLLRPPPSPAGSVGSRSNTPASLPGNQAGSPMPPRPPSTQYDSQNRMSHSPMATQGFNQSMMPPPPSGPNQMGFSPSGSKMPSGPGMNSVNSSQMPYHSQFNSQFPGNFPRHQSGQSMQPSGPGMGNYPQQAMFNGPSQMNQMSGNPMYNNMSMNRNMNASNYTNQYSGQSNMNIGQFGSSFSGHMGPGMPPGQTAGPRMSGPNQGNSATSPGPSGGMNSINSQNPQIPGFGSNSSGSGIKGAKAAAQAAMLAAAQAANSKHQNADVMNPHAVFNPNSLNYSNNPNMMNMPNSVPLGSSASQTSVPPHSVGLMSHPGMPTGLSNSSMINHTNMHHSNAGPPNISIPTSTPASSLPGNSSSENLFSHSSVKSDSSSTEQSVSLKRKNDCISSSNNLNELLADDSPKEEKLEESISDEQELDKPSSDLKSDDNASIPSEQDNNSSINENVDSSRVDDEDMSNSENQKICDSLPAESSMELSTVNNEAVSISSSISDTSSAIPATSLATGTSNTQVTQSITTPVTSVNIISSSNETPRINTFSSNAINYPQSSLPMLLSDDDKQNKVGIATDMSSNIPPTSYSSVPNSTAHIASLQRLLEDGQPDKEKKQMDMPSPQMNHVPPLKGTLPMLLSDNSQPPPEKKKKRNVNHDVQRMYEMGDEPERKQFLDRLFSFMEDRGTPVNHTPQISKQSLDLFRLYLGVRDRGGMLEVTKNKKWKEICAAINIGSSASAAFTLKKNYIKHLFPFECRFDRGGLDPQPILAQMEAQLQQKRDQKHRGRAPSPAGSQGSSQDAFPAIGTPNSNSQGLDPFSPGMQQHYMQNDHGMGHMGGMVPGNHQMMNRNSMMQAGSMHGGPGMHPQMGGPNMMMPNNYNSMPNSGMMGSNVPGQPQNMMGNNMNGPQNMMGGPSNNMYPGNMNAPPQQNSMMSNMNAPPANSMIGMQNGGGIPPGGNSVLTNQDSVSVKDPFSDDINSGVNNFSNPSSSALTQSSFSGMPTQSTASSNFNYNRPSMPAQNVPASFSGNNQNNNHVGFEEGGNKMHNQGPESCSEPTPLVNSSDFQSKQSGEGFNSGVPVSSSKDKRSSFPFGSQFERPDKFDQSPPTSSSQPFRPSTSQAISQPMTSDQMYPGSYGNQMPVRTSTPQEQFGQQQSFPGGSFKNRTPVGQEQSQSGFGNTQGPPFPGPRHPMNRDLSGSIHSTPNKQYNDLDRRDRYMSPGGPGQRPPPVYSSASNYDDYSDPRRDPSQWSSPMTSRYPAPQGTPGYMQPYNSFKSMGQRMSPTRDRGAMSPSKSLKPGSMMPNSHMPTKKEIVFPPDSLEATQPLTLKRRKLTSKDIGPTDAWRLMLALKSGLLAESTWALDVLNVMLYDDNTLAWFNVRHLPGLIDAILDFYRRCLIEIFDVCDDIELGYDKRNKLKKCESDMCENTDNSTQNETESFAAQINDDEKVFLNKKIFDNYSRVTRYGKVVEVEEKSEEPEFLYKKDWDIHTMFDVSGDYWQKGGADISSHIVTRFESSQNASVMKKLFFRKKMKLKDEEDYLECVDNSVADDELASSKECDNDGVNIKTESITETLKSEETIHNSVYKNVHIKLEPSDMSSEKSDVKISDEDSLDTDHMNHGMRANGTSEHTDSFVEESIESIKVEKLVNCNEKDDVGKENIHCDKLKIEVDKELEIPLKDGGHEPESFEKEDPPLCSISESQHDLERRCICISNIIRSLSFVPGNDKEFSKHSGLLRILGKLILLHHQHLPRIKAKRTFEHDDPEQEENSMVKAGQEWWWNCLYILRDNTLVTLANIGGALDLSGYPEEICFPIINGLLHWTTCPAACARDALPTLSPTSVLSAQRLVLETMCKLCVHEKNVDLILATPPFERVVDLFKNLKNLLANKKEQMTQEFAIVLMSYLVQADSSAARAIALQHPSVSLLIDFLEIAEQTALQVANTSGINVLRENPEIMGTSLDMLRKAAMILLHLARVPENRTLFVQQQSRLLSLVMSQILDQTVAQILSDVLFECSQS